MLSGEVVSHTTEGAANAAPMPQTRGEERLPSIDLLRKLFAYNPNTGAIRHRFTKSHNAQAGELAGTVDKNGRRFIAAKPFEKIAASRVAWAMYHGKWPTGVVDHKDKNPSNDRITNLRDTNQQQNVINSSVRAKSRSGCRGVAWDKSRNKWVARIKAGDEHVFLGRYDTKGEAISARLNAEKSLWGTE